MIMSASCHLFYIVTRPRGLPLRGNGAKIVRQVAVARRDLACPLLRAALVSRCDQNFFHIIALASATGEKQKKKKKSLGQGGAEGPDAGSFYGGGGRRPPTTRANTGAPRKKFSTKVEKLASAIIHDCVKLKTRLSRKRPS